MDENKIGQEEAEAIALLEALLPAILFWVLGIIVVSCFIGFLPLT